MRTGRSCLSFLNLVWVTRGSYALPRSHYCRIDIFIVICKLPFLCTSWGRSRILWSHGQQTIVGGYEWLDHFFGQRSTTFQCGRQVSLVILFFMTLGVGLGRLMSLLCLGDWLNWLVILLFDQLTR